MKRELEKYISNDLIQRGINLKEIARGEILAWSYENVMEVIDILNENNVIILGGDIMNNNFLYTGDSWAYENLDSKESIEKTRNYIKNYYQRMGNNYYYVLVVK